MPEHTFPLPERITEKLEAVEEELEAQPILVKASDFVRANPWQTVAIAAIAGFLFSFLFGNRR